MKIVEFKSSARQCSLSELPEKYQALVETAKQSVKLSYSPYSHFAVGAAVLLENGDVYNGANQENAAYPSGLCAERTALFYANAQQPQVPVEALAVACFTGGHFTKKAGSPCGNCRQVMLETEHRFKKNIAILLYGEEGVLWFDSAQSLLPHSFVDDDLNG